MQAISLPIGSWRESLTNTGTASFIATRRWEACWQGLRPGNREKRDESDLYRSRFPLLPRCSFKNWLLYYPIEKGLSALTDCLITINEEDFVLAKGLRKALRTEKSTGSASIRSGFILSVKQRKCCSGKHTVSKKTTLSSYIPRS